MITVVCFLSKWIDNIYAKILVLLCFVYFTRNEDVNYTIKIKKILNAYRSFIQEIDGEFNTEGYQLVPIKSFIEMLGIRDTIQSPILMYENEDQTMTRFFIPTNTKMLYVYEIKVENYDEIYARIIGNDTEVNPIPVAEVKPNKFLLKPDSIKNKGKRNVATMKNSEDEIK